MSGQLVVFASGIVDDLCPCPGRAVSTTGGWLVSCLCTGGGVLGVGVARCWGSEASGPPFVLSALWVGGVGGRVAWFPARSCCPRCVGVGGGVGLLFEIWIVDASIFVVIVLLVCETSYEGHMVDALASRADEGRWSLR